MSVKEGLLEHEHIALNTTIYYVTKQQIDNWKFSHKPTTIGLHKLSYKPWKRHSADRQWKIIDENINFCFGTPINRKITVCLLINLTRSPPQKRLGPPSPPLPSEFSLPSVCWGGGGGGGYGYFLELHIVPDITKTSSNNWLIFTSVSVDSSPLPSEFSLPSVCWGGEGTDIFWNSTLFRISQKPHPTIV